MHFESIPSNGYDKFVHSGCPKVSYFHKWGDNEDIFGCILWFGVK